MASNGRISSLVQAANNFSTAVSSVICGLLGSKVFDSKVCDNRYFLSACNVSDSSCMTDSLPPLSLSGLGVAGTTQKLVRDDLEIDLTRDSEGWRGLAGIF